MNTKILSSVHLKVYNKCHFNSVVRDAMVERPIVKMAADERMTPEQAAIYQGKSKETLAKWRAKGIGPLFLKSETGRIYYFKFDIDEYWQSQRVG